MRKIGLPAIFLLLTCSGVAEPRLQIPSERVVASGQPAPDKAERTPAQQKISSALLDAIAQLTEDVRSPRRSGVEVDGDGTTLLDIEADVTAAVLDRIEELEGTVVSSFPQYQAIRARLPLDELEALAEMSEVRSIRPADIAVTRPRGPVWNPPDDR